MQIIIYQFLIEQNKISEAEKYIDNCINNKFVITQYLLTASKFFIKR